VSSPQPNSKAVTAKRKRCGLGRWALTMVAEKNYWFNSKHPSAIRQARKKSITLPPLIILDEN
jgi:hypothetical protein